MRTQSLLLALTVPSLFVAACGGDPPPPPNTPPPTTAAVVAAPPAPAAPEPAKPAADPTPPAPAAPKGPPPAFQLAGFQTPESVLYDEANDRYLVSNINGKPLDADNNGYISVVSPEGKMVTEKWIAGGQNKVTLNAPKGTAIAGGVLYVADIDTVRMFDAKSGAPKGEHKVPGATFLNDVSAGPDGRVYVSDSGLNADFGPTGTDAIYAIEKGKLKTVAKDASLGKPNGLLAAKDGVWAVTFGTGELYRLDTKTIDGKAAKVDVVKLPKGQLDGIVMNGDQLFISSWEASGIFKGKATGPFEMAFPGLKAPADLGLDKKRSRLLVPHFMENMIEAYDVK
jgi:sugar lactone lactonase YvrE